MIRERWLHWPQHQLVKSSFESLWKSWSKNDNCSCVTPVKQGLTFNWKLRNCNLGTKSEENLVINFGQTLLPYVCTGKCTHQSVSNVPSDGNRKKNKQVTGTFTIALSGQFLPMQLFYQETTDRCLPKSVEFPHDWNVTYTPNHWSNESKAVVIMWLYTSLIIWLINFKHCI